MSGALNPIGSGSGISEGAAAREIERLKERKWDLEEEEEEDDEEVIKRL